MRFEHCYALDASLERTAESPDGKDASDGKDAKIECWRDWLHGYTYAQSRDRVDYAAARLRKLSLGPTPSSDESRDAKQALTVASPMPTSAFAPPPNLAAAAPASAGPPQDRAPRAPGAECSDGCSQRWTACHEGCKERVCDDCDKTYRKCVPMCFRDDAGVRPVVRGVK